MSKYFTPANQLITEKKEQYLVPSGIRCENCNEMLIYDVNNCEWIQCDCIKQKNNKKKEN